MNDEKTEMQMYADVRSLLTAFIPTVTDETWEVKMWSDPSLVGLQTNLVLLNYYDSYVYGWTSTLYNWDKDNKKGTAVISWIKDMHFDISFFKDRKALNQGAGVDYSSALDLAQRVRTWFQSDFGREKMQEKGFQCLVTSEVRNPIITLDDETYSRDPNFSITFVRRELIEMDVTQNYVTEIDQRLGFRLKNIKLIGV